MLLCFPDQQTLRLAITSGLISEALLSAPVQAALDDSGAWHVRTARGPGRKQLAELAKLGVERRRSTPLALRSFTQWMQLLPIRQTATQSWEAKSQEATAHRPVLFEIRDPRRLAELVSEILRLGNDRMSFQHVKDDAGEFTLLRVVDPPYYTLLRALEPQPEHERRADDDDDVDQGLIAYIELAPRVWVQFGYEHECGRSLAPTSGELLLLRPPRQWRMVPEAPMRDVYELVRCGLPGEPVALHADAPLTPINIPLRLAASTSSAPAELWVLRDNAEQRIEELLSHSDDRLLARLAFAVASSTEENSHSQRPALASADAIVLRARPSREAPPILVLDAIAFRPFLHLPNLFLPMGWRLQPPLRRDVVSRLLCPDPARVTWLWPETDGAFTATSMPDAAFRPLSEWVNYVIDRDHVELTAWRDAHRFDFESFVCEDDQPAAPPKEVVPATLWDIDNDEPSADEQAAPPPVVNPALPDLQLDARQPTELQRRLAELELTFQQMDADHDDVRRVPLWREMGRLHAALGGRHESTLCWANAIWEPQSPDPEDARAWWQAEAQAANWRSDGKVSPAAKLLSEPDIINHASPLAAYLHAAACESIPPEDARRRLPLYAEFLQRHEAFLPARVAWLGWCAVHRLSSGDVLALARARDRLLQRLFQRGLEPEVDMPTFLRGETETAFSGQAAQLLQLDELIQKWVIDSRFASRPHTRQLARLMIAFALARIGESGECERLRRLAMADVQHSDPIHHWVSSAFSARIDQTLRGEATTANLYADLMLSLERLKRVELYKVDRIRQQSRILEPHQRIQPYRRWHRRYQDQLSKELSALSDQTDPVELQATLDRLLLEAKKPEDLLRVLASCLEFGPRLGEAFSLITLDRVAASSPQAADPLAKAMLLLRAILVAGHFGRVEQAQSALDALTAALPAVVRQYLQLEVKYQPDAKERLSLVEGLFMQSFWELRKLGMRADMTAMYERLAELVQEATLPRTKQSAAAPHDVARKHRMLCCVAAGWYFFGRRERAASVADEVRRLLHSGQIPAEQSKDLACAYAHAVAQAPSGEAMARITELFALTPDGARKIPGIEDNLTPSSHFSIYQLDLIETCILSLVGGEMSLSLEANRWLDEDEYCVRRRIHQDVRRYC